MKKLKVLHTVTRMIVGGASENTMLSAQLLDKNKYDVRVLTGTKLSGAASLKEEAKRRGVVMDFSETLVREINPIKDLKHFIEFASYLKKHKFDIVHTHSSKAGIIHRIVAYLMGTKVVVHSVHGWSFHDHMSSKSKKLYVALEKLCAKFCHKMITVTDKDIEKGLKENIATRDKYTTIHSSIEIDRYSSPDKPKEDIFNELGLDPNKIIIGTVSRMSEQKAPLDFLYVAKEITKIYPNTQFLFIGGGNLKSEFEAYVKEHKLEGKVVYPGVRYDVQNMLAVMDIFILTSLWEGLPRVFSQSMAAKLPVVATKVDGAPEIIEEGFNGFMTKAGKPDEVIEKLKILIEDKEKRIQMGENGFKRINPDFCVKKMVQDIDKLYQQILRSK
jgi:glycosyltransferase involved in cell wall biosynthesis